MKMKTRLLLALTMVVAILTVPGTSWAQAGCEEFWYPDDEDAPEEWSGWHDYELWLWCDEVGWVETGIEWSDLVGSAEGWDDEEDASWDDAEDEGSDDGEDEEEDSFFEDDEEE